MHPLLPDNQPEILPGPFYGRAEGERQPPEWRLAIADPRIRQHDWWVALPEVTPPGSLSHPGGLDWPSGWSRWQEAERGELTITLMTQEAEPELLVPEPLAGQIRLDRPPVYTLDVAPAPRLFYPTTRWGIVPRRVQIACQDEKATWRLILHYVEPGPLYNRVAAHPTLDRSLTLHWTEAARG